MSAIDSGLIIYPGEEVHKLGHKMHIVSIGASKCISRMLMDDYDNIKEEALKIAEKHTDLPEDVDPLEFGMQRWVFEQIKKLGGLSVLAHPYWPHEGNATYIPASLSRLIIEEGYSDAWEITGVDDGDKDFMQNVLYTEECEKGFRMPVVGATDAHDKSGLGDGYTIVFAEDANISSVTAAIKNHDDFYTTGKQIYYDTDNIYENQRIRQRLCPRCGSYRVIDSAAERGYGERQRVLCYSIPLYCCESCREEARHAYRDSLEAGGAAYDYIYLQDRAADDYRRYDCVSENEEKI